MKRYPRNLRRVNRFAVGALHYGWGEPIHRLAPSESTPNLLAAYRAGWKWAQQENPDLQPWTLAPPAVQAGYRHTVAANDGTPVQIIVYGSQVWLWNTEARKWVPVNAGWLINWCTTPWTAS